MRISVLCWGISFTVITCHFTSQVMAEVRKCLEDSDCHRGECCAQAFYLFRCERIGYRNGDSCGLCGCRNRLTCVTEGINPFKVLSGRGVCRHRPATAPGRPVTPEHEITLPPPLWPTPPESEKTSPPKKKPGKNGTTLKPWSRATTKPACQHEHDRPKPGKDRFHEIFQPIYEQFIAAAVSMAGITIDDITTESISNVTSE